VTLRYFYRHSIYICKISWICEIQSPLFCNLHHLSIISYGSGLSCVVSTVWRQVNCAIFSLPDGQRKLLGQPVCAAAKNKTTLFRSVGLEFSSLVTRQKCKSLFNWQSIGPKLRPASLGAVDQNLNVLNVIISVRVFLVGRPLWEENVSYVYWTVYHLDSWIKRDQLDVTCFTISLFNAQHVSDVNTSILRSLRLICWVISWVVLLCFDVCWCYGVVWLGWCGIRVQTEACIRIPH